MAFSTGFGVGYSVGSDIAAKKAIKKEKERTEKLVEELKTKIEEYQLSGDEISYSEKMQLGVLVSQLGQTYASTFSDINNAQSSFDKEKLSQEAQNLRNKNDMFATLVKEIKDNKYLSQADLSALDEITGAPFSKLWNKDVIDGIRNEETKQQTLDNVFGVAKELPEEYTMPYMAGQGVEGLTGLQPTPEEPTALSAKDNWAIENYKTGKISFDQLSKYMGAYIEPEKATELQKKIAEAKQYGATNEEIKNMLLGTAGGGAEKSRVTSLPQLEEYRDKALNADSWEDAEKIINDYTEAGYDSSQLGVTEEAWANNQKSYLDNIKKALDNITDEKGWLKKGKFTKDQVGLEFTGERTAEEIYKILYEQYMKYFNMLTEMGLPLLEFPILKPLEEIEKVGFWEGAKTFGGVGKGQYKSIYK